MNKWGKEWFGDWFNSPYYHVLYKNRDDNEAQFFINHLVKYLKVGKGDKLLDVACGKGRHAIFLNSLGFEVDGIDLSESNISLAKTHENESLRFYEHDMREPFKNEHYDFVFNLFTSIGYFEDEADNQKAITAITASLKNRGFFILDFLNPYKVINHLVDEEIKLIEGIEFHINRSFDGTYIIKDIRFEDGGKNYQFQEKVKAIRRMDFLDYFRNANLLLKDTFGSYSLEEYHPEQSDRMIFITQKL